MEDESLSTFYVEDDVNIDALRKEYKADVADLSSYSDQTQDAYEQRRCHWDGKTSTLRKEGPDSQPWEGASDQEVRLIENAIGKYVGLFMTALQRSNIRALPREASDIRKSRVLSSFLKYLRDCGIKDFRRQMELGANYMLEKGLVFAYSGVCRKNKLEKIKMDAESLAEVAPEMVEMLADEDRADEFIALMQQTFEGVNEKRAKKALKEFRKSGVAEFPVVVEEPARPFVRVLAPDGDIIGPSYVMDVQSSPRWTVRALMTVQEIENAVAKEGWDADWANDVIENYRGVSSTELDGPNYDSGRPSYTRATTDYGTGARDADDVIEVLYTFRRLYDEEDSAEGIYLTVWHGEAEGHAFHELQEGMSEYPFVMSRLVDAHRRIYDLTTFSDMLRGPQRQAKTVRDGWSDQQSLAVAPPFLHPVGRAPSSFGAGAWIGVRPTDRYEFLQVPDNIRTDTQIEKFVMQEAFDLVGLDPENPLSGRVQQYYIEKFLYFVKDCIALAYKQHVLLGDEEVEFRVTGQPEPITLNKSDLETDLDISITFDSLSQDPESMRAKVDAFIALMQSDANGRLDQNAILEVAANMIDPSIADEVLRPLEEARADILRKVADDLSLIWSGQSVGAQPTGAQVAIDYIQNQYIPKPSVAQRLQTDPTFAEDLSTYVQQYEFQLQQQTNAVTGRLGTEPTQLQGVNVGE